MTVTIQLPSEIEADLIAQAQAHGLNVPQYVEHVLREQRPTRTSSALTAAERADAWR
jgi:hypothetical protein